jgi:hypothetical protein
MGLASQIVLCMCFIPTLRFSSELVLVHEVAMILSILALRLHCGWGLSYTEQADLPLYKGVPIQESISKFIQQHGVSPEEAPRLRMSVQKSLQDKGLAPITEIPFDVSGKRVVLPLFSGQNVTEQVLH